MPRLRRGKLARGIDDAEAVPLGIGEDDVVRIRWSFVPMDFGRAQRVRSDRSSQELDESLARGVDYAKPVSLGIGEDDVVRIRRSLVPVNLGCA